MAYGCNVAVSFILLASARYSKEKDDVPGNTDFCPHFQIHGTDARVKSGTHEVVIEKVSRHPHRGPRQHRMKIGDERDAKAVNHRHGHQVSEIVDYFGEAEDVENVEDKSADEGDIKTDEGIAVIFKGLVIERRDWHAFLLISGEYPGDEKLEKKVARVDLPRVEVRTCILFYFRVLPLILQDGDTDLDNVRPHTVQERLKVGNGVWMNELAVIEPKAYPQIVHEDRKTRHNSHYSPGATKFIPNDALVISVKQG